MPLAASAHGAIATDAPIAYDVDVTDATRYPGIGDYALIGDSRTCALVSRDGSIDWMCLPNFDSPSMFGRLLDWGRGGYFQIAPAGAYDVRRRYLDATNVLVTTFLTDDGEVDLIDFMPALTEDEKARELQPLRALIRLVECRSGAVPMRIEYAPRPQYGSGGVELRARTPFEITAARRRHVTHLRSDVPLDSTHFEARATFVAVPGRRLRFSLAYSNGEPAVILSDAYVDDSFDRTIAFWRGWSAGCTYDGAYCDEVLRSALTLKMLSYAPSGAIVAAPTTSLPEQIGGDRNWDYRYCWIRDAAFTVKAFLSLGLENEAQAFVGWLMTATNQTAPRLDPLYTLYGDPHVPERELAHLEGYRGSKPVRVGNAAAGQRQLDVYGELIDAYHSYISAMHEKVSHDQASFIAKVADYVAGHWREPDNGIWEARVPPTQYTHSKVMAWDALVHAIALHRDGVVRGDAAEWERQAHAIREQVLTRAYNATIGAFTQTIDGDTLDASILVMPLVGIIAGDDPRMLSTIDAMEQRLSVNGFLLRYDGDDGLAGGEGAFVLCNFWLAAALAAGGRTDDARNVFERTLGAQNDLGLLSEEWDAKTGEMLGNFPQALSHIALITAALTIDRAERGGTTPHHAQPNAAWPKM